MTIEERKEQEEKQKEWVKARINCTIRGILSGLECSLRYDVNTYNESDLMPKFEVDEITGNIGVVVKKVGNRDVVGNDYVSIRIKDSSLEISRNEKHMFTVTPRWDETALECKLLIRYGNNETTLTFPQISQKAIGELLFKPPVYPGAL